MKEEDQLGFFDYFFTKTACEIRGFYTSRQTDHALLSLHAEADDSLGEVSSSEGKAPAGWHPDSTYLPMDSMTDAPCRVIPQEQLAGLSA